MQGQLTIEGREVQGDYLNLPSLGRVEYEAPEDWEPGRGDRIRIVCEFVVEDVTHPEKHNSEGVATEGIKRIVVTRAVVPEVVSVAGVLKRAQIEAAWNASHGATEGTG